MFTPKSLLTWTMASSREPLVHRVLGRRRALERVRGDGAEEPPAGLAVPPELRQRRRGGCGGDLHHPRGARHRGQDRDRDRGDDPADHHGHALHVHQLLGLVDGHGALALAVADVGCEVAARDAARLVDVAERHLDRLGAGLAVLPGGARELHHHAHRHLAVLRRGRRGEHGPRRGRPRDPSRAAAASRRRSSPDPRHADLSPSSIHVSWTKRQATPPGAPSSSVISAVERRVVWRPPPDWRST